MVIEVSRFQAEMFQEFKYIIKGKKNLDYLLIFKNFYILAFSVQSKYMYIWPVRIAASSWINQGAVFLRTFTVAFLLFLAPRGGGGLNLPGQSLH